ncbi:uncharacterized protein LOC141856605 [Brevipalpus obovatus]|uniref:uncharacterized protein LOC141856605 n=1 Tax=Brevipalpus obovatus TaxID=246614 RepID=UPI003D9E8C83
MGLVEKGSNTEMTGPNSNSSSTNTTKTSDTNNNRASSTKSQASRSTSPRPSSRSSSNHHRRQSVTHKPLPADSVLFAPVFQEEKLLELYRKLAENTPDVSIMKEKLIEKAKMTLETQSLSTSHTLVPFFHFDEFEDVHLSFLQHNPPYTPWFAIIETYFGPLTLELHLKVYNLLLDYEKQKTDHLPSPPTRRESIVDDHDHFIEIDQDDEFHPRFIITQRSPTSSSF